MRTVPVRRRRRLFSIAVAGVLVTAFAASAADNAQPTPSVEEVQRRLKDLEDTVERLKKDQRQTEITLENQKPLASWQDGFVINSADGRFKLKIGGYVQADGRFFIDDSSDLNTNQFLLRRVRPDIQGTVFKYFDFRILPDFGGSGVALYDAYLDFNYFPQAKLRFGKFKPPVGLERLQSATALMFVERGQPTNLVPNRDDGVQFFGDLLGGALSYQLGVFNGVPDNSNPTAGGGDVNDDKDFAGRVFASPFKNTGVAALKGLGLGLAGTYGRQRGTTSSPDVPTYKSFGQATIFRFNAADTKNNLGPVLAFGERSRISPQAYYYFGPFGALFEYVHESQVYGRDGQSTTLGNDVWQVGASYVLTGESASYKGVAPSRAFEPLDDHWGWGAFELAARYGELEIDRDAFSSGFADPAKSARRDEEFVVGGNWYLNKNVRVVLDYGHTHFAGGATTGNRDTEHAVLTRVQLTF